MAANSGFSIIICTYNGVDRILPTLQSISKLKTDGSFSWELIIVDNASTDNTNQFCKQYIDQNIINNDASVIYEQKPGLNNARVSGLRASNFDWILFCDDDNIIFEDYLLNAFSIINQNTKIGALGGQGIATFDQQEPEWFKRYYKSFAVGAQSDNEGKIISKDGRKLYGACCIFKKSILLKYFENDFNTINSDRKGNTLVSGGDIEFCILIELSGYELWYAEQLKFYHHMPQNRMNWAYFLKLKKGGASGSAKMSVYQLFYQNSSPSIFRFLIHYTKLFIYHHFIALYFFLKSNLFPTSYNKEQMELGKVIVFSRAQSFRTDFNLCLSHFIKFKKLLNSKKFIDFLIK